MENSSVLLDYCARRLGSHDAARVDEHLAECRSCAEFVGAQSKLWAALDDWDPEEISAGFDGRLYAGIEAKRKRFWSAWGWKPAIPLAAACATAVLALFLSAPVRKAPPVAAPADTTKMDGLEAEQIDRTVEDLEMLRQFATPGSGSQTL